MSERKEGQSVQQLGRFKDRNCEEVVEAGPEKVRAARKAHHGKSTSADGSSFVTPLKKGKTSGGAN